MGNQNLRRAQCAGVLGAEFERRILVATLPAKAQTTVNTYVNRLLHMEMRGSVI
jgi:hypothetical protein